MIHLGLIILHYIAKTVKLILTCFNMLELLNTVPYSTEKRKKAVSDKLQVNSKYVEAHSGKGMFSKNTVQQFDSICVTKNAVYGRSEFTFSSTHTIFFPEINKRFNQRTLHHAKNMKQYKYHLCADWSEEIFTVLFSALFCFTIKFLLKQTSQHIFWLLELSDIFL